jgi:hypothetical protein
LILRAVLHKAYWWVVRRTSTVRRVRGMDLIDARGETAEETERLVSVLDQALGYISQSDEETRHLVESQLQFVAALKLPGSPGSATVWTHGYICPFDGYERTNPRFLAVRLVWAAAYTRRYLEAYGARHDVDEEDVRRTAYAAERAFANGFPDREAWLSYIQSYHPGVHGRS